MHITTTPKAAEAVVATTKARANRRQLVTAREAVKLKKQHTTPCADCPWARKSLPGWTGGTTPKQWLEAAHGEAVIECHTTDKQCAGAAIYRANVLKSTRHDEALRLPANKVAVFASFAEFLAHHQQEEP